MDFSVSDGPPGRGPGSVKRLKSRLFEEPTAEESPRKLARTGERGRASTTRSSSRLADVTRRLHARRAPDQAALEALEELVIAKAATDPVLAHTRTRTLARIKSPWASLLKMRRKGCGFDDLRDVAGFKVIVRPHANDGFLLCDRVLEVLREDPAVASVTHVKDYMRAPKASGYQSLHALVALRDPRCSRVEVQVRSEAMEYVAEQGSASHAAYFKDQFSFLETTPETTYRSLGSSASDAL